MARTGHKVRSGGLPVTSIQMVFANCAGELETGSGGTLSVKAALEYNGVTTPVLCGGAATGTTAGNFLITDVTTVPAIPDGSTVWARFLQSNTSQIPYCNSGNTYSAAMGDQNDNAGPDVVYSTGLGGFTGSGNATAMYPVAILGYTAAGRRVLIVADSRGTGFGDTPDASGDLGEWARALGPTYAYANWAVSGSRMSTAVSNYSKRRALAATLGFTDICCSLGINDYNSGATAAVVEANMATFRAQWVQRFYTGTMAPRTTGTWTAADHSDQTLDANNAQRVLGNNSRRALASGATGNVELADFAEFSRDIGYWKADGTAGKYTVDGLHQTAFLYKLYSFSI